MKALSNTSRPTVEQLKSELARVNHGTLFRRLLRSTAASLLVVAAAAVLASTLWLPVLQIYGASMAPALNEGDIVIAVKASGLRQGDLAAFYLGNKILVKRCIAGPGQWVDLDREGNVYVDGSLLDEPYLSEKAFGGCDLELPCLVPEGRYFCLGDHRAVSVDSRHTEVGWVSEEQILGKIVFRVWPLPDLGTPE